MLVLAIESSSHVAGAALVNEDKLIAECILNRGLTHSEYLMTLIDNILTMGAVKVEDIDIFGVSKGPGSFTGLRIGIATIKGLAQSVDRPVVGVPTLDGLAYNVQYTHHLICPIMDARRGQVYTSLYEYKGSKMIRIDEYNALPIEEVLRKLVTKGRDVIFLGDAVGIYKNKIKDRMGEKALFAPAPFREQRPSSIASLTIEIAHRGQVEDYRDIVPFYLRKSQAEQRREEKF
ncbi:MAG TPA: tRNA (adenosine(37)-N6)-threonylcarbamoyltransferase complex dimerization subunit type 1 TsaB [Clostridiales bacterium]|nr:tRNA (adenosine(37)-N6)-threonylcarbamoyltransferase complex dimerization subunit type 1 TsaB [Clostridiales bacterium]